MKNFYNWSFSRFMMDIELKIWEFKVCFDIRKLNKLVRCGTNIQEFVWRFEIQFGTLFLLATSSKSPWILN
jgi:hypothetical protein